MEQWLDAAVRCMDAAKEPLNAFHWDTRRLVTTDDLIAQLRGTAVSREVLEKARPCLEQVRCWQSLARPRERAGSLSACSTPCCDAAAADCRLLRNGHGQPGCRASDSLHSFEYQASQQSTIVQRFSRCSLGDLGSMCSQMGKVRSLDELDEVGEADESAASVKLMDEVISPASPVTMDCCPHLMCEEAYHHCMKRILCTLHICLLNLPRVPHVCLKRLWLSCAVHLSERAARHQQHHAAQWSDTGGACAQLLLGHKIEEDPPPVVYVYESTVDCLKQTEDILASESSFGFLVDPNSFVEQSMQELMQDLCSGPNESAWGPLPPCPICGMHVQPMPKA